MSAGVTATAHVPVAAGTEVQAQPLLESCTVKVVEGGGGRGHHVGVFFVDDAVSAEVQWEPDGGWCLALAQSLASLRFRAVGGRAEEEGPLVSHKKATYWAPQQEVLVFDLDTEVWTISLSARKIRELQEC